MCVLVSRIWRGCFSIATLFGAGGEKVCAVGGPDPRPEDLLCGECTALTSPARSRETCTVHGTDHIVWKCRFCCGVAVSDASGTTSGARRVKGVGWLESLPMPGRPPGRLFVYFFLMDNGGSAAHRAVRIALRLLSLTHCRSVWTCDPVQVWGAVSSPALAPLPDAAPTHPHTHTWC
jgi:hypothetical protein